MKICAKTDRGMVRESNQDVVNYGFIGDNFCWVLICDGMGGQNSGEVASNLTSKIVEKIINSDYNDNLDKNSITNLMTKCLTTASSSVFEKAEEEPQHKGMGTTAVLAFIKDNNFINIAYVGDSRAYLIKNNEVKQLTVDHSMVQEMVDCGEITEEEAKVHPRKNIITRAIGINASVEVGFVDEQILENGSLLLCTDGFSNYISNDLLLDYFSKFSGETLVSELINHANNSGGADNVTVAVIAN